jgi:putative transposase
VVRRRRIALVGHPHLVTARGNNGDKIFLNDADCEAYLSSLREMVRAEQLRLHAWCLQKTELRLVVAPLGLPLGQIMQKLHTRHTRRANDVHDRTGHLFEGRFASTVLSAASLVGVVRDVHLWPVRSGKAKRPETYAWSSHKSYIKGDEWGDLVDAWHVLSAFGDTIPVAQRAFARFVESALLEPETAMTSVYPGIAGGPQFAEAVLAEAGVLWRGRRRPALATLVRRVCLLTGVAQDDVLSTSRQQELVLARRLLATTAVRDADRTVTEVAAFMVRDKSQVSRLVQQGTWQARTDEAFRSLLEQMKASRGGDDDRSVDDLPPVD